jgi:hypothetical protein
METRPGKANLAGRELASWRERSRRKRMWRGVSAFLSMAQCAPDASSRHRAPVFDWRKRMWVPS